MLQAKPAKFVRPNGEGCSLTIEVSPGAKKSEITGVNVWRGALQIKIAAQPREGAANEELLAFLGRRLDIDKNGMRFLKGKRSSIKTLFVPMPTNKVVSILGVE